MKVAWPRLILAIFFALIIVLPLLLITAFPQDNFDENLYAISIFIFSFLSAYFMIFTVRCISWWTFTVDVHFRGWLAIGAKMLVVACLAWGLPPLVNGAIIYYAIPLWVLTGILGAGIGGGFFLVYMFVYLLCLFWKRSCRDRR